MPETGYRRQPVRPLGAIVREALATVAMECGPFSPEELANFDKIASGEMTTGEYRAAILAEIEQESRKKQRK